MRGLLTLLHLADTSLPVGGAAHSFGLETLAEDGALSPESLQLFLADYLVEAGRFDAAFVRRALRGADPAQLSLEFAARRPAREAREAAFKMGQRFSLLVNALAPQPILPERLCYPVAFGAAAARFGIGEDDAALAYLRQSVAGLISAAQRLIALGQVGANRILWNLQSALEDAADRSRDTEPICFTPLPELASMRHAFLETRLFIS